MDSFYPEILEQQAFIEKVIKNEEERFSWKRLMTAYQF